MFVLLIYLYMAHKQRVANNSVLLVIMMMMVPLRE